MLAALLILTACPTPDGGGSGGGEEPSDGKIGEIKGTITLTNIPNPAPKVYISARDFNNKWHSKDSQIKLDSVTGTSADINWSIPIYDNDDFKPSEVYFNLWIEVSEDNGFGIQIPVILFIPGANANAGDLGSVSLRYITLSGTLNVTYDWQQVPRVRIEAGDEYGDPYNYTQLASPGPNAPWSITLPAFNYPTPVYFRVYGYPANGNETLFEKSVQPNPLVSAHNQNIPNISLNVENIAGPNTPVNPVPLAANTWKDDTITNGGDVNWYSISVTGGTTYYLWWNDADGDGSKTLDIDIYAYDSVGNQISLGSNNSAWDDPVSFTANSSGTVYVRARAYGGNNYDTGTYAIAYNTSGTKPAGPCTITFNSNAGWGTVPASITAYPDTSITLPGGSGLSYFSGYIFGGWDDYNTDTNYSAGSSYPVTRTTTLYARWVNDETYTVYFNLNGGSGTTPDSQTGNYGTTITLPSGSGLTNGGYTFGGWYDYDTGDTYSADSSYTISTTTTLYARWISYTLGGEGNPIPLTEDAWADGEITSATPDGEVWYSFNVTGGNTYYVWWNDSYNGDSNRTLDVKVTGYNTNGSNVFTEDAAWSSPQSITANSTGTVKLKVYPYYSGNTGTFAIAYSTSGARPGSGGDPSTPTDYTGTYTGSLRNQYNSQSASSVTLTAGSISGGTITINNVSIGEDNAFSFGGLDGTWAYVYSEETKIGIVFDISSYYCLVIGKTAVDSSSLIPSVDTNDMADYYRGELYKY
jgi:hypothetical protein